MWLLEADGKPLGGFPSLPWDGGVCRLWIPGIRGRDGWVHSGPSGTEGLKKLREGSNFKFHTQLKMRLIQNYSVRSSGNKAESLPHPLHVQAPCVPEGWVLLPQL